MRSLLKTLLPVLLFSILPAFAQSAPERACAPCIQAEMQFLASDALRGRGSGTEDEHLAAEYIGAELHRYGIEPAGDNGSYVQTVTLKTPTVAAPPTLTFSENGKPTTWTHGQQMLVRMTREGAVRGPLQKVTSAEAAVQKGAIVFLNPPEGCGNACPQMSGKIVSAGAAAVLFTAPPRMRASWQQSATRFPQIASDSAMGPGGTVVGLTDESARALAALPDGTEITIDTKLGAPKVSYTWNAVGILRGADPTAATKHSILLTAHLDHLGVGQPVNGDSIYNGADDDASGCVAVLELAHALASGPKPKRTVVFALFGSEEKGGLGSQYWLQHPTVPLDDIAANLEFEMIGRSDAKVAPDQLWLTGWERSNLGPELASHGAKLVPDPHPEQGFFTRSDNIVLAKKGVVAQTVSSFGVHGDYHRPSDDYEHVDFAHMDNAITSMIDPVRWLANSDFVPQWKPGKKP